MSPSHLVVSRHLGASTPVVGRVRCYRYGMALQRFNLAILALRDSIFQESVLRQQQLYAQGVNQKLHVLLLPV